MNTLYKHYLASLFFSRRFYVVLVAVIFVFVISYSFFWLLLVGKLLLLAVFIFVFIDYAILYLKKNGITAIRQMPDRFSIADDNKIIIHLVNNFHYTITARILEELPEQFQVRSFILKVKLKGSEKHQVSYKLKPLARGEFIFHNTNILAKSPIGLITRKITIENERIIQVYPSFYSLRKYELIAHSFNSAEAANKKIRKLGQSLEFEQIKDYVRGDDYRTVNWKATARKGQLMVNHFSDEKSQQIYCVIDMGRGMQMPFEGLSLLDYAINSALVLSNIALLKQDKAGIITFSDQLGSILVADKKASQMQSILELLYNQKTRFLETDFEKLYAYIRTRITQRSLVVLYTNFESMSSMQRQLPYLRKIARHHLLLVVLFENTELRHLIDKPAYDIESIYIKTIGEKFAFEKKLIVKELQKYGILSILTAPKNLTVNTLNKYLELKARQAI